MNNVYIWILTYEHTDSGPNIRHFNVDITGQVIYEQLAFIARILF